MARDCTSYGPQRHTARNPRTVNQLWLPDRNVAGRTEPRKYINVLSLITRAHFLDHIFLIHLYFLSIVLLVMPKTSLNKRKNNSNQVFHSNLLMIIKGT